VRHCRLRRWAAAAIVLCAAAQTQAQFVPTPAQQVAALCSADLLNAELLARDTLQRAGDIAEAALRLTAERSGSPAAVLLVAEEAVAAVERYADLVAAFALRHAGDCVALLHALDAQPTLVLAVQGAAARAGLKTSDEMEAVRRRVGDTLAELLGG